MVEVAPFNLFSSIVNGSLRLLRHPPRIQLQSPFIYRGEPLLPNLIDSSRSFSDSLDGAMRFDPTLNRFCKEDTYRTSINGTSLKDIEAMNLPLTEQDIRKINRVMGRWHLPGLTPHQKMVRELASLLPVQVLARFPKLKFSEYVNTLSRRLSAYYDYFLPFIDGFVISEEKERQFIPLVVWIGTNFQQALGAYIPARLGLTPSSVCKMLYEVQLASAHGEAWKGIHAVMIPEVKQAYTEGGLPSKVAPYQHYDQSADRTASLILESYYSKKEINRIARDGEAPDRLVERLGLYRAVLRADILSSPDRFLRHAVDNHEFIREILVATQNRQTLILVVMLNDNQTHLTLEVNGTNRLYGIPPRLSNENPHIGDLLAEDVLGEVLNQAKTRHPDIESERSHKIIILPREPRIVTSQEEEEEESGKMTKKSKLRLPMPSFKEPADLPKPTESQPSKIVHRVFHTRSGVIGFLGKRSPKDEVDQIMQGIKAFERGERGVKLLGVY